MICSNFSVLNKIARSSLSRNLASQLSSIHSCRLPITIFYHTKSFQNPLTGSRSEQRLFFEPLTRTRHELTFVRWQFDFNKKAKAIPRKASWFSGSRKLPKTSRERNLTTLLYLISLAIMTAGASYAAVPLYRVFCQASGYGGTTQVGHDTEKIAEMEPKKERKIRVMFNADTAATMRWNFRPQQAYVEVYPGETALAFYTAKNPTDKPIDGISTYNVIPFEAGQYFNKIQCFCFEEQRLNPKEEVDMPVFFYIDPEFVEDPFLENTNTIFLSYTFFESMPGFKMPTIK